MSEPEAANILSALSQPTRLKVVVLLAEAGPAGLQSGDIADTIGIPRNLMSSHLTILQRARVLVSRKVGRSVVYAFQADGVLRLVRYLESLLIDGQAS